MKSVFFYFSWFWEEYLPLSLIFTFWFQQNFPQLATVPAVLTGCHIVNKSVWACEFVESWTTRIFRVSSLRLLPFWALDLLPCFCLGYIQVAASVTWNESWYPFPIADPETSQVVLPFWDLAKSSSSLGTAPWPSCPCPYSCTCRLSTAPRGSTWSHPQLGNSQVG